MKELDSLYPNIVLKGLRAQHGVQLAAAAVAMDVTTSYLSLVENGKKPPSRKVLNKAAVLYNVPVEKLLKPTSAFESSLQLLLPHPNVYLLVAALELLLAAKPSPVANIDPDKGTV